MRFHQLDLNLVFYLDALLGERNVSRAARRVHLTQSAMSDALGRLRDYFQDRLLVKSGHAMLLSPLAQSLIQPVRDVLLQLESIAALNVQFDPCTSKRKITVLAPDYVMDVLLKNVIRDIAHRAPGMQMAVRPFNSTFVHDFDDGSIDLLVTTPEYSSQQHPSETLYYEKFTCVVWSRNSHVGKRVSMSQYKSLGHVCVSLGDMFVSTYDDWFMKQFGQIRKVDAIVPSYRMALDMITGTQRIATCHVHHARMFAKQYSLRLVEPPFKIPPLELRMQRHKYKEQDPALAWFRGLVKSAADRL
jgi:LysR family transcriptional regulator, nod-box dependent transcriptional activator